MIRRLFIGQEAYEAELGAFTRGLLRIRQNALIVRVDGGVELVLERISGLRFLPPTSVTYLHLPADGLDDIEAVASDLQTGASRPQVGAAERLARAVLLVTSSIPALLGLGLLVGFLVVLASLLGSAVGLTPSALASDPGPLWVMGPFAVLFAAVALDWLAVWLLSLVLGEPLAVCMARRFGHPEQVRSMGTWRGAMSRAGLVSTRLMNVRLRVMQAHGRRRYLVMLRTHRSPMSAGVATFPTPVEQVPGLLRAIVEHRHLSKAAT